MAAVVFASNATATLGGTTVLYDNLGKAFHEDSDSIAGIGPIYQSFTTDSSLYILDSVQVSLGQGSTSDKISVGLYVDSADPSTIPPVLWVSLGSITDSSVSLPSGDVYTVSLSSTPTLAANTRYWIGLSEPATGTAAWDNASTTSGTGVAGGHFWSNGNYNSNSSGPYQMAVTANAVPEPAQAALVSGLLCISVGLWLRRR
jgi:hypothetical protein